MESGITLFAPVNDREVDHLFFLCVQIKQKKIFTLSNYGFYMFLVKLSIHFTRVREGVDRLAE